MQIRRQRSTHVSHFAAILAASLALCAVREHVDAQAPDPQNLVARVVDEAGGPRALRDKGDVEYTYVYRKRSTGTLDISVERYAFDGEKSWARYEVHENLSPEDDGPIVQGYDGKTTWQTETGKPTTDPAKLQRADFLRKTNFYWLAMIFKLLDPGLRYTYEGRRQVDGVTYEIVRIGFDDGVGDVSDTYVLYIDPRTWRVDQFLFTVLDYGRTKPFLMEVEYDRIDGVLLPTKRRYGPSDWSGTPPQDNSWTDELSIGIRFGNRFGSDLFERPW